MRLLWYLDENYKYPNSKKVFKLKSVSGFIFHFECGHWCTDNVFADLIRVRTGKMVLDELQLDLFLMPKEPNPERSVASKATSGN